jgi:hypothetical protein
MILQIEQGLREDGHSVPMTKLCRWFGVPRRTVYYKPVKTEPKVQERFAAPIKQLIESEPSFGCRTVAGLLQFNKNTVQRIFQIKGWQVRKRAVGHRPRIEALPSVATTPNERWATDLCRVWAKCRRCTERSSLRTRSTVCGNCRLWNGIYVKSARRVVLLPRCEARFHSPWKAGRKRNDRVVQRPTTR